MTTFRPLRDFTGTLAGRSSAYLAGQVYELAGRFEDDARNWAEAGLVEIVAEGDAGPARAPTLVAITVARPSAPNVPPKVKVSTDATTVAPVADGEVRVITKVPCELTEHEIDSMLRHALGVLTIERAAT